MLLEEQGSVGKYVFWDPRQKLPRSLDGKISVFLGSKQDGTNENSKVSWRDSRIE